MPVLFKALALVWQRQMSNLPYLNSYISDVGMRLHLAQSSR